MTNLSLRAIVFSLIVLALSVFAHAQAGKVSDLKNKVDDLVFRVDDMGGKVLSLEVKESPVELRIELAAGVPFDFDKAEIVPKAQQTIARAAQIVREKAKGSVRMESYTDADGSDDPEGRQKNRRVEIIIRK